MTGTAPLEETRSRRLRRLLLGRGAERQGSGALPYALIAPLVAVIGALAIYPAVVTLVEAFFHLDALTPPNHFVGFGNFEAFFSSPQVRQGLLDTGWYVLFGVCMTIILGTGIALLLRRPFRGRGVMLAIVILPWGLPGVVSGVIWSWIYDPTYGVLNSVLKSLHLISHYELFVGQNSLETMFFISLVQVWQITPLAALVVLAALQSIPDELYESARVDGASWFQEVRRITIPLVRPGIAIAVAEALVMSINIFDQVYVLNSAATAGSSLMSQAYFITFQSLDFGEGYAISLFATFITIVLSVLVVKVLHRKVDFL